MPAFLTNRHWSLKLLPHRSGETKELTSFQVFCAHWHLVCFDSYNKPLLGTRRIPEKLEPAAGNTVGLLSGPSQPPQTEWRTCRVSLSPRLPVGHAFQPVVSVTFLGWFLQPVNSALTFNGLNYIFHHFWYRGFSIGMNPLSYVGSPRFLFVFWHAIQEHISLKGTLVLEVKWSVYAIWEADAVLPSVTNQ